MNVKKTKSSKKIVLKITMSMTTWSDDTSLAEEFLLNHKSVKIVVAIDTHSADNGYFVWTGSTADTYHACSLLEVTMFAGISIQTLIPFPDTLGL